MTSDNESLVDRLSRLVARRVSRLQSAYRRDESAAVADLALLRRGVSQQPGDDPRLLGLTIAGIHTNATGLPEEPTPAERAAYAAMTLFAVHQQSQRTAAMHREGRSFGRSARDLARQTKAEDAVRRRFTTVATATSWPETTHHARAVIQQLRAQGIPLDYGRFARDLYWLQSPSHAQRVRLTWGRDYYRVREDDTDTADEDSDTSSDVR